MDRIATAIAIVVASSTLTGCEEGTPIECPADIDDFAIIEPASPVEWIPDGR